MGRQSITAREVNLPVTTLPIVWECLQEVYTGTCYRIIKMLLQNVNYRHYTWSILHSATRPVSSIRHVEVAASDVSGRTFRITWVDKRVSRNGLESHNNLILCH